MFLFYFSFHSLFFFVHFLFDVLLYIYFLKLFLNFSFFPSHFYFNIFHLFFFSFFLSFSFYFISFKHKKTMCLFRLYFLHSFKIFLFFFLPSLSVFGKVAVQIKNGIIQSDAREQTNHYLKVGFTKFFVFSNEIPFLRKKFPDGCFSKNYNLFPIRRKD